MDDILPSQYHDADGKGDPYAQIDQTTEIPEEEYTITANVKKSGLYR